MNAQAAGFGVDIFLKDGKFRAAPVIPSGFPNLYRVGDRMVSVPFLITACGVPVPNASVTVSWAGNVLDVEGNTILKVVPSTQAANIVEAVVDNSETTISNAAGVATVGFATATFSLADGISKSGTLTVSVAANPLSNAGSQTFTFTVFNG